MSGSSPSRLGSERPLVTLGAVGDIGYLRGVGAGIRKHGADWPFERVRSQLESTDILFGNMESVFLPPDYPSERLDPRALAAPFPGAEIADSLVRAGFTFMNLAQNHVLDAGVAGMRHTREVLEAAGLRTGGVGDSQHEARKLVTLRHGEITVGFLCYCEDNNYVLGTRGPCHAYYQRDAVLADVVQARDLVDVLVVSVHADIEFMPTPSVPRRDLFREIASAGAHVVLGHHPHVPQGCEMHGNSLIAYSLGNFLFPARTSPYLKVHLPRTAQSFILKVMVGVDGVASYDRIPVEIRGDREERPVPLEGEDARRLVEYFEELDAHLDDEDFLAETWRRTAREQLARYLKSAAHGSRESLLARGARRVLGRLGIGTWLPAAAQPDIDRVIEDLVPRLCLIQENRLWMEEILRMGVEAHEERMKAAEADPFHRPHYHVRRR